MKETTDTFLHQAEMDVDIDERMETGSGDLDPLEGKPHPMLFDHIVEKITRHLISQGEDDAVLQSRLVCHTWDRIATKSLRFHSNKTVHFGKYFRNPETLLEFRNYLLFSTSPENFPLGKFYLCENVFEHRHLHTVQTFFRDCASLLTSLTIRLDNQSDLKVSELDFSDVEFSHLKSLTIDDRRLMSGTVQGENEAAPPTLLQCLVEASPNLECLSVIHLPSSLFDDDETAANRRLASEHNVVGMLAQQYPRHLKYLNLDIKFNDKVFQSLSEIPFKLQELHLSLRESVFSKESLHKLLEAHAETLRILRLCSMGTKSHFEISFPVLPSLTLLELHSWDFQVQGVTMSKFSYQQYFPQLTSLVLHTWAENPGWIQFFPAAYYGTVPSLTSLKLPQNFMYPAMIQNLSWLYPNLRRLDVHFSRESQAIIHRIFSHFPDKLEELKIRGCLPTEKGDRNFCLDPLFTGLTQSVCDKILRRRQFDPNPNSNHWLKQRNTPSLLNLKKLHTLDIDDMLRHAAFVTDVTGYLVLLQMPSLRHLTMGRSQINDECLQHLAKKYPTNMEKELMVPKASLFGGNHPRSLWMGGGSRLRPTMMYAYDYCMSSLGFPNTCRIC